MLNAIGCGLPPKAHARIDIDTSFGLGPRYLQNGEGIDSTAMISMLEAEHEAASHVSTAKTMSYISTAFAAAGGALIGWPLGESISGERHPLWVLAGIGAGVITLSIPFSAYRVYSVDNAVKAHNRNLMSENLSWPSFTSPVKPPPPPPPKGAHGKPPKGAAGFTFGSDIATAEANCTGAGFVWQKLSEKQFSCSGTPTDVGMPGTAKLTTCEGIICKIAVKGSFEGVSWNELKEHFSKLSKLLEASYGPNTQGGMERLADCTDGIPQCLEIARVRKTMQWRWKDHHEVSLILSGGPVGGPPSLLLLYSNPAYSAESP